MARSQVFDVDAVVAMFDAEQCPDVDVSSSSEDEILDLSDPEATTVVGCSDTDSDDAALSSSSSSSSGSPTSPSLLR